jgi:DnaK suppressor protein
MKKKKAKIKTKTKTKPKVKAKVKAKKQAKPQPKFATTHVTKRKGSMPRSQTTFISIAKKNPEPAGGRGAEEKPLSVAEIRKFRDILTSKQEELSEIVHRKKEEQEFQQEEPEIGDEADIATRSVEKELLFDITDTEKQTLDGVEAAIRKIEKGVFGRCESCQKTIPRLRLEVMPWARYCISCQARNEIPSAPAE